jgi:drug/metabolite transporter (DMT)-like permease
VKSTFSSRDALLLCLLALIWGHSFLFVKLAVGSLAPTWIVTTRMLLGGTLLLLLALARRDPLPRDSRTLGKLAFIGLLGSGIPWAGQAWAQAYLDSGLVAVLNACTPLATLGLAVLSGQERLERHRLIGIAIAIAGTLVVVGGEVGAGRSVLALVVAVLATLGYAYAAVFTRGHITGRIANVPAAAFQLLLGAAFLVPLSTVLYGPPPSSLPPLVLAALLALGLLGTGIGFLIYFTLLGRVGATNTSMVTYLIPLVAILAGTLVRGERFGANVLVGALLLVGGVWIAQRRR